LDLGEIGGGERLMRGMHESVILFSSENFVSGKMLLICFQRNIELFCIVCYICIYVWLRLSSAVILKGKLVRAALCRRCLTAVGHYLAYFGPSVAVLTVYDSLRPLFCIFLVRAALCRRCLTAVGHYFAYFWSERSACDQRSALRWPLFCIY
jgi:hypothetical protein